MPTRRTFLALTGAAAMPAPLPALADDRLRTVATFSILGDFAKNVGGDRIALTTLVGPDGDVHVYTPAPADAKALNRAKVIVVNGLGLEGWISRLIDVSATNAPVVVASKGVMLRAMPLGRVAGHSVPDPHAWQSIDNAKIYVANIRDALGAADPPARSDYEANANSYLARLDRLDSEVKEAIGKIPADRRKVITTHYSFGYFGAAYGMEFISPEGVSTDAEPSAKDVAMIIAQIRHQKIPAVFLENINDPRLMQRIAEESGARIGGTLYADALSPPGGPAGSYIDMMRHNVRELTKALAE